MDFVVFPDLHVGTNQKSDQYHDDFFNAVDQKGERDIVERTYNAVEAEKALGQKLKKWNIRYNTCSQKFTWTTRAGFIEKNIYE